MLATLRPAFLQNHHAPAMNDPLKEQPDDPSEKTERQENLEAPCLDSAELLGDRREIRIRHGGEMYRLRLTRSGKLILHK